jgi:hypothetical protein
VGNWAFPTKGIVMAKICSLHDFELRSGVDPAEFERVFREEVARAPSLPGFKASLLKSNRGARDGKFAALLEIEDEGTRGRYFPRGKSCPMNIIVSWSSIPTRPRPGTACTQ